MKTILKFLRDLSANNNREWFQAHKDAYLEAQQRWNEFCAELIERIGEYDPSVRGLTVKDCTYRIYRDVRFSKDKSPYKTHMGVYICRGGKKSGFSGYYFHISAGQGEFGLDGHIMAAGDYMSDPRALQVLREDIENGDGDFADIVSRCEEQGFSLDPTSQLKRVPKGFDPNGPYADYLRYKVYCLMANIDEKFVLQGNLAQRVADSFRPTKEFLDYVNRAIEYAKEEA